MNELELAQALFDEYSAARNMQKDDYCTAWEHLDSRLKETWLTVARRILSRKSVVVVWSGL